MCRAHFDPFLRFGVHPPALTAGEDKSLVPIVVDDGKLKIAFERRRRYRLPHEALWASGVASTLI